MADGTCAAILRYEGDDHRGSQLLHPGTIIFHGKLWIEKGNYNIAELLVNIQDQGKGVNLFVLSGTELVEGGPVIIVNSQQFLLSQFSNKELYFKYLTNVIGFPAMFCREPHTRRDTQEEPLANIMREGRLDVHTEPSRTMIRYLMYDQCNPATKRKMNYKYS